MIFGILKYTLFLLKLFNTPFKSVISLSLINILNLLWLVGYWSYLKAIIDFLYIKYGGKLDRSEKNKYFDDADVWLYGRSIELFVEAAKKYSNYDVSEIEKQLHDKKIWYVKHNPTHPELSNREIDFDVPIHFIYRTDENAPYENGRQFKGGS